MSKRSPDHRSCQRSLSAADRPHLHQKSTSQATEVSVVLSQGHLCRILREMFPLGWAGLFFLAVSLQCSPVGESHNQEKISRSIPQIDTKTASPVIAKTVLPFSLAVAGRGEQIYLGRGRELLVFEKRGNSQPDLRGRLSLEGEVRDIVTVGPIVYVAVLGSGLAIVDVTEPSQLHITGFSELPLAEGVDVESSRAYLAVREEGLVIIDVADSSHPTELGRYQTQEGALKVSVKGQLAYVAASYAGMRILDIGDPAKVLEVGFTTRGSYGQGSAWGIAVAGDRAYSAIPDNGLRQVDISDPNKARTLSIYRNLHAPIAVAIRGDYVFVADQNDGLVILDRRRDFMREVARLDFEDSVTDIHIAGSMVYVALKRSGFAVVDVINPIRPKRVTRVRLEE
jgi:hypothetical protein